MNVFNVLEAIQARRSVRAYLPKPLEPEKLETILAAANQAPSAGNLQAYQIRVVRDEGMKKALVSAALDQHFLAEAPVVLLFSTNPSRCERYGRRGADLYSVQDATIAAAYAQLAATAGGLATCWVGAFDEGRVAQTCKLPHGERPIILLPLGYAAEKPGPTSRRSITDLVVGER
jgi:nitroreductase